LKPSPSPALSSCASPRWHADLRPIDVLHFADLRRIDVEVGDASRRELLDLAKRGRVETDREQESQSSTA
jgi:hypothetical protein